MYTSDLSHVTGKAAVSSIIKEDFSNLNLTFVPEYSPSTRTGIAQRNMGTQFGKTVFILERLSEM